MDLFSTNSLVGMVEDLRSRPPEVGLLSVLFPTIIEEPTEEIHFDTENKPRRIAPLVNPLSEGKLIEEQGYTTATFKPAYVKPKRVFDPNAPLKRIMGEALTGSLSPEQRIAARVAMALAEDIGMIRRRKEVMAAEALRLGQVTVTGEGVNAVVDFARDPALTLDLSGGASEWDDAGVSPVEDVEDWSGLVLQKSGAGVTDIIFTPSPWKLFRADTRFEKAVELRRGGSDAVDVSPRIQPGLQFQGTMGGGRRLWTYYDWYVNDAGLEVPIIPDNEIILASGAIDGVQVHGAIRDEEAGFQAMEFFPKSWTVPDPSVRYLMTQSAPLVVPFRANASMGVTVT